MVIDEKELKKKIEEIEEQLGTPSQKKRYRGYKKGFTRRYVKYK